MRAAGRISTRWKLALALVGVLAALATTSASFSVTSASGASFVDSDPCPTIGPLFTCPTARVGQPYSIQLKGHDGCDVYWFEILNSQLPVGLSMNTSGVISGVPTAAGRSEFYVQIHDLTAANGGPSWCGGDGVSQKQFLITVDPGLSIVNQAVKGGTIGQPYSETLTAKRVMSTNPLNGTDIQATWSLKSGALPPGVNLTAAGALEGTPTTEGSYQFTVQAQDGGQFDSETYTITVRQPVVITSSFPVATPPKSEVGVPFEATVSATGGTGTYTWTLAAGSLPTGVEFDPTTGAISGTPEEAGRFTFSITATDTEGRVTTLNVTLTVAAELAIKTLRLKAAKVGRLYQAKLATLGGVQPVRWKLLRGKPPLGVRFAKKLGTFVGTPRRAGTFRLTVQASDSLGVKSQKTLVLVVKATKALNKK